MAWREVNTELELLAIVEVNLWPRDGCFFLLEMSGEIDLERIDYSLDVFACAERIGFEIRAIASIVAEVEAADGNGVLAAGIGIGNAIIREYAILAKILNLKLASLGPLAAKINLFLAKHESVPGGIVRLGRCREDQGRTDEFDAE
jgi:hypothetical protein